MYEDDLNNREYKLYFLFVGICLLALTILLMIYPVSAEDEMGSINITPTISTKETTLPYETLPPVEETLEPEETIIIKETKPEETKEFPVMLAKQIVTSGGNITINQTGSNFIIWGFSNTSIITSLSIDGIIVSPFDYNSKMVYATNLKPNSLHSFNLNTKDGLSEYNSTYTLSDVTTNEESFWYIISFYLIFLLGILCIVLGIFEPMIGFGGFIFGIIGLASGFNNSFIMGSLYCILIIASIFVVMRK